MQISKLIKKWSEIMIHAFSRTELLLGKENLNRLKKSKIGIFGIGGVGSYAVEALARSSIGSFILIDYDEIDITNINRQIHATTKTIGRPKVNAMRERILDINPQADVKVFREMYRAEIGEEILSYGYDYVVDAIDMVTSKIDLIERCFKKGIPIISSMGAGNKINPTMLEVDDIYNTSYCPLARVMRTELKKRNIPSLKVVYSKESPIKPLNTGANGHRKQVPGSISFVPPVAGLILASEVIKDLINGIY